MRLPRPIQLLLAVVTAIVLLSTSREANAQPYSCSSTNICYSGTNTASSNGQAVYGNTSKGSAVVGQDSSSGQGILGQSSTGIGVVGTTGASESLPYSGAPSQVAGVYGYGASTGDYGGFFVSAGTGTLGTNAALYGDASGSGGTGVLGAAVGNGGVGGYFTSPGVSVAALYGNATASGGCGVLAEGPGYGIWAQSSSGYGAYVETTGGGTALEATNTTSTGGYGILGKAIQTSSSIGVIGELSANGAGYAIYGNNNSNATGAYAGWFEGNVEVTGTFTNPSDERLKKNIQPVSNALDQLLKLRGVTFEWKDPGEHAGLVGTQRGFIAQEVEKVFPNWVSEDAKGIKSVDMRGLEALEVESIRTLKARADNAEARANALARIIHPRAFMKPVAPLAGARLPEYLIPTSVQVPLA
jgi:endosialidase-like protein